MSEDDVMVAVVLKPGESMTPEEHLDFYRDKMANFMIPRYKNHETVFKRPGGDRDHL